MVGTKFGLYVVCAALVLGLLGDALLRAIPWGINLPIWTSVLVAAILILSWTLDTPLRGAGRWMLPAAVLFSFFIAWRAAPMLVFLNISTMLVALYLVALRAREGRLASIGTSEYLAGGVYSGLCSIAGPIPTLVKDVDWTGFAGWRWRPALAVMKGVFLAAPLLLVFGSLFFAADAVFEDLVLQTFDFDVSHILGHLLLVSLFAWISAGTLRQTLVDNGPDLSRVARHTSFSLGPVEVGIALGTLNVLFLVFTILQVQYLFGGADVLSSAGLTYAEYARRGFFELVAVTALVLPLLLILHWALNPESRGRRWLFRAFAGSLLVLLLVIVVSALYRMRLYLQAFGLTELRFYSTAFIIWLTIVLAWFAVTVLLLGRRDRFAYGALLAGFVAVVALNTINPDATIARVNLDRSASGERFDPYYLTSLSTDATPVLVEALPERDPENARILRKELKFMAQELEDSDWRSWNLSRRRAADLFENSGDFNTG